MEIRCMSSFPSPANFKIVDLTEAEITELDDIDKTAHFRSCHPSWTGFGGLGFPDCKDAVAFV